MIPTPTLPGSTTSSADLVSTDPRSGAPHLPRPVARLRRALVSALAVLALVGAAAPTSVAAQASGIAVGSTAPDAALSDLEGKRVQLADVLRGGPVVIEFWATWCPLCRALEPGMAAVARDFGGRVRTIRIGVPDNQTAERQAAYVERQGIAGLHLFDGDGAATRAFLVPHTSYVVVVDADGIITYTGQGKDQDLVAAVRGALGADGGS